MPHYDIAIIGAGPSGCTCALALHNSGMRVVLVDKDDFPRDKICGDAIPGPAFKVLDKINKKWGEEMKLLPKKSIIRSSKGFAPNGRAITFNWKAFAYNSKRIDFDNFLFELVQKETDTHIITKQRLVKVEQKSDHIVCRLDNDLQFSAAMVIGCDGANSMINRMLVQQDAKKGILSTAVRAYYKGVKNVDDSINEFHFFNEIMPGYFWIFPVGNGWVNVGLGTLNDKKNNKVASQNLRKIMEEVITTFPTIAPRFEKATSVDKIKGFALPLSTDTRPLSGDRFILCGDAASLISPLWGHGIDTGMWSGYYAAEQAKACFSENNFSGDFIKQYDAIIYEKITRNFIRSAKMLRLINQHPYLLNVFWFALRFEKIVKWVRRVLRF